MLVTLTATPELSAGVAYGAGDAMGDLLEFTDGETFQRYDRGTIVKIVIVDNDLEDEAIDVVFFDRRIVTDLDNQAFAIPDEDVQHCIGYVGIAEADYSTFTNNSVACVTNYTRMKFPYVLNNSGSIFVQLIYRGQGATYTNANDLAIKITVERTMGVERGGE